MILMLSQHQFLHNNPLPFSHRRFLSNTRIHTQSISRLKWQQWGWCNALTLRRWVTSRNLAIISLSYSNFLLHHRTDVQTGRQMEGETASEWEMRGNDDNEQARTDHRGGTINSLLDGKKWTPRKVLCGWHYSKLFVWKGIRLSRPQS